MKRTPSNIAQLAFKFSYTIHQLPASSNAPVSLLGRSIRKLTRPAIRKLGTNHTVSARLYGQMFEMPAEHPLAAILVDFPQYNRPLGLAAEAIALSSPSDAPLSVVDIGANIGETIAIIEQYCPGRYSHLCIEADEDLAELCMSNHKSNPMVQVERCFIGEDEGARVYLKDDGRANSSTKVITDGQKEEDGSSRLVRLDTVAHAFAETTGNINLIKVDTEGYDFSVLRSGHNLLQKYKPAIYFEWYPELLLDLNETVWDGFEYLAALDYRYFVFFSSIGDYYCKVVAPNRTLLRSLADLGIRDGSLLYFDVFASTQEALCDQLIEASMKSFVPSHKI